MLVPYNHTGQTKRNRVYKKEKTDLKKGRFFWGGRWGSNPRPSVPQTDALTN